MIYKSENAQYLQFIHSWSKELEIPFYNDITRINWILNNIKTVPKCVICDQPILRNLDSIKHKYPKTCCRKCRYKSMHLQTKLTCIRKYGVTNNLHIPEVEKKIQENNIKKYGHKTAFSYSSLEFRKMLKDKYGNEFYCNREQTEKTNIKRYGNANGIAYGSNIFKQRLKERYGVEYALQNRSLQLKQKQKYQYNGIFFDSQPEIALYIWLIDNKINFDYNPIVDIWYIYKNKKHRYFPDFRINGKLVEIKGDQFFDENGNMKCPFRYKTWSDEKYKDICGRYAAKHKCMLDNNVQILRSADYKQYLDYIDKKYGKKYLAQFKVSNKV